MKPWENYEKVARYLLNKFAHEFELASVDDKQKVPGKSGTSWEIDAKGVLADGETFLIVECKRYTTGKIDQSTVATLAFQITDTDAEGGILVSPFGLQEGGKKIAEATKIIEVKLDPDSTYEDYFISFMKKGFAHLRMEMPKVEARDVRIEAKHNVKINIGKVGIIRVTGGGDR